MARIDFIQQLHSSTKRDYVGRVVNHDKAECAEIARQFGRDYWDGERHVGYGGYHYDGRWAPIAEQFIRHYGLKAGDRVLDIGCGKGFLLYEMTRIEPGLKVSGIDISRYAIENAKLEVRDGLTVGTAAELPYEDGSFDFVFSHGTLHNLKIFELYSALHEISRVGKSSSYVMVESYRDEKEKANLLYWQLTCQSFYSPEEWEWIYRHNGYGGDWGYIFFT